MKTGEPIIPIMNGRGYKIADLERVSNYAVVKFPYGSKDILTISDLEDIICLMKKKELDWCAEPKPRDRE